MKTNTTNTAPTLRSAILHVPSLLPYRLALLLAATVCLLQGCTTARPAWSYNMDATPRSASPFEPVAPWDGVALLNLKF
jgi:hypothetical protein